MNKLIIIGNLTRDPELRTTQAGLNVCTFTVAVNRRRSSQSATQPETDFFRVTAWRQMGENCHKFLTKGKKVAVVGPVSVNTYEPKDGSEKRYSLEVTAEDVEFLTPGNQPAPPGRDPGYSQVDDDDFPFD